MLRSTVDLLLTVHHFFDEIGYNPTSENFDDNKVVCKVVNTINHSKELDDALYIARLYEYYICKRAKFINKYRKYPKFWDTIKYDGRQKVNIVSDKDAVGIYYITNIYGNSYKDVFVTTQSLGNELYEFENRGGCFSLGDEADYYISYAALSSKKMNLFNSENKKVATIVLSEGVGVFLENNKTQYEIELYEAGMAFFDNEYIHSISGEPDLEKCKAFVQWDIVDKKGEYGLSRLDFYDEDADLDLMITIAASCFLLFRAWVKKSERSSILPALFLMNTLNKH